MTLDEKIDYLGGADNFYIRAIKRLGLPAFRMADGPFGVRNVGPSTAYPAGIGLAASWDVALANRVGAMIGRDARARGVADHAGAGREHLPGADVRPELRVPGRGPVPGRRAWRSLTSRGCRRKG